MSDRHKTLFDDDIKVCLSDGSGTKRAVAMGADRFDFTVQQSRLSYGHNTLSDDDIKVCLSYDSGTKRTVVMGADRL